MIFVYSKFEQNKILLDTKHNYLNSKRNIKLLLFKQDNTLCLILIETQKAYSGKEVYLKRVNL